MMQKIKSGISNVWDFYRTAPFGETSLALFGYYGFKAVREDPYFILPFLAAGVLGVLAVKKQFKLKRSLEDNIRENGFTSECFERTIPTWCGRQTARVVAEKHGCLDEYIKLCEQQKQLMTHNYIPHI